MSSRIYHSWSRSAYISAIAPPSNYFKMRIIRFTYPLAPDGYPSTVDPDHKLLIGYGANADRYEDWLANPRPLEDHQQPSAPPSPFPFYPQGYPANPLARDAAGGYLVTGQVEGGGAAHTGTDVPLSAGGRGAARFHGVIDNTDVFFEVAGAVLRGGHGRTIAEE